MENKKKSKKRKIIEWSITGFFIALLVLVSGVKIYQKVSGNNAIFGSSYPVVLTDSMEDDYMVDDVLIVKSVNPSEVKERFDRGETVDISFYYNIGTPSNPYIAMMTHRIIDVMYFEDTSQNQGYYSKTIDGKTYSTNEWYEPDNHYAFVTHGINTKSNQGPGGTIIDLTGNIQITSEEDFIGLVTGKSGFLTFTQKVFSSVWTLILLILVPALYIIISTIVDLAKALDDNEEKAPSNNVLSELSEKDKERLKKEMLEEMMKAKKDGK